MRFLRSLYIRDRFFYLLIGVILLFVLSFLLPSFFGLAKGVLVLLVVVFFVDILLLYNRKDQLVISRIVPEKLSNGDANYIQIKVHNQYRFDIRLDIIDELPVQFQERDFEQKGKVKSRSVSMFEYKVLPLQRGQYFFGNVNVYVSSILGLVSRRYKSSADVMVPSYPSFLQMRKYELMAFTQKLQLYGMKKIRKIGHSTEFDQIKDYVTGDDIRHINWKATAKRANLMVNQFQEERAQPVYSIIDKGRVMKMPFHGLSLLDYSINAALAMSNIVLRKQDKAGILAFSNRVENMIVAERRNTQMQLIMESLYHLDTDFKETDFGRLYTFVKSKITHRSLLMVYSNFETMDALNRQLKYLKALSKMHLVVLVFFKNTELDQMFEADAKTELEIYDKAAAEKFEYEKRQIILELRKYGIHTVLSRPEDLTADTINKYLELKSRGLV